MPADVDAEIDRIWREESRGILATLIRLLGDFDVAEDALHEAFRAAVEKWPSEGLPQSPRSWLISAGRFKAIDNIRRLARFDSFDPSAHDVAATPAEEPERLGDDRLRLIFTCCHPALSPDAQVALTLREVAGLTTEEIAAAFLVPAPTLAQRIVRAKTKIRDAGIPYEVPEPSELAARLEPVLRVLYLVFNEGYSASSGAAHVRADLASEAIRLGRLLLELLPEPETMGLVALMLLHDARRDARTNADGDLVLLDEQDRSRWNRAQIDEGAALVERALRTRRFGPYALQAAIAAVHAQAPSAEATDWHEIVGLYDALLAMEPSPVVALNRGVAIAMRDGPAAALDALVPLERELAEYRLFHAARADFLRRLERHDDARRAYEKALALCRQDSERRFLERRIAEVSSRQEARSGERRRAAAPPSSR